MRYFLFLSFIGLVIIYTQSCNNDTFFAGDNPQLTASSDTLTFDTVFTTIGSATRFIKIYNDEPEDILIDVSLRNSDSKFRINVDGISGENIKDIRVPGNDSIYIFADVTVDPDQPLSISPFIIEEYLDIQSGNSQLEVLLTAWGQNANYIPANAKRKGVASLLSCDFQQFLWDDPKPYVIYGRLLIDECELVIPEGTQIYIHGGLVQTDDLTFNDGIIFIGPNGTMNIQGSKENPVIFQGDRLEQSFDNVAGQWVGIWFLPGSQNNQFNHVQIKNSIVGVRCDSSSTLELKNTVIRNTSSAGLIGVHANIQADNTMIYDNGQNALLLTFGGQYRFRHCTFASYGNQSAAVRIDNFKCLDPPFCSEPVLVNTIDITFENTIITGNEDDELILLDWTEGLPNQFNFLFDHCGITIDDLLSVDQYPNFFDQCIDCIRIERNELIFLDQNNSDYSLDTLSTMIDRGKLIEELSIDLFGNQRDEFPDLGAVEFVR